MGALIQQGLRHFFVEVLIELTKQFSSRMKEGKFRICSLYFGVKGVGYERRN